MGCGHSKISIIYSRKSKSKRNSKKSEAPDKSDSEEEDGTEKEKENCSNNEDDQENKIQVKSLGGALLAQIDISSSQQDFFRMLDEKIQNGPDYNSESETEILAEHQRIKTLLKDWETASAGSRSSLNNSFPNKTKNKSKINYPNSTDSPNKGFNEIIISNSNNSVASLQRTNEIGMRNYSNSSVVQVSQSIIHQNYGVSLLQDPRNQQQYQPQQYFHPAQQPTPYQQSCYNQEQQPFVQYRQVYNDPNYAVPHPGVASYPTQYQVMSPMYSQINHPSNSSSYGHQQQQLGFNQYPMKTAPGFAGRIQPSFKSSSGQEETHSSQNLRTSTPKHVPDFSNGVLVQPRFSSQNVQLKGARDTLQSHYQNLPSQNQESYVEPQHHQPVPVTYETVPILVKANNAVTYVPRKQFSGRLSPE